MERTVGWHTLGGVEEVCLWPGIFNLYLKQEVCLWPGIFNLYLKQEALQRDADMGEERWPLGVGPQGICIECPK